jgi:hypothetical protein
MSIKSVLFQNVFFTIGIYCIYKYYSVRHFLFIDLASNNGPEPIGGYDITVIGVPFINNIESYNLTNVALIFLLLGFISLIMSVGMIVRQLIKNRALKQITEA